MRNRIFAYAKTKTQISFAVTAKLISAFVFATYIEQSLYFLYRKFQASSHIVWLYSLVCVRPGRKSRRPISHNEAQMMLDNAILVKLSVYPFSSLQIALRELLNHETFTVDQILRDFFA